MRLRALNFFNRRLLKAAINSSLPSRTLSSQHFSFLPKSLILLHSSAHLFSSPSRLIPNSPKSIFTLSTPLRLRNGSDSRLICRNLSCGSVKVVFWQGKVKFETYEVDPPKKDKWKTKKRLKLQRKREKQKRKAANKRDPRQLNVKGKKRKQKFANAEERIKYKLEKARVKEALLVERLKKYEVPKLQGPVVQPYELTGEERFYLKKMAQKGSNYVPVGRRGIFGGVVLNMHMHWKKHETVKLFCKPCKPGQIHEYAQEIARLSGGIPIQIIGEDTIIFYRGKNYVQPEVMSPIDTLSKKRALEKSKYEQSLETVRHFIAVAEMELELYYRHNALYGNLNKQNADANIGNSARNVKDLGKPLMGEIESGYTSDFPSSFSQTESSDTDNELSEIDSEFKDDDLLLTEFNSDDYYVPGDETGSDCEEREQSTDFDDREASFSWVQESHD